LNLFRERTGILPNYQTFVRPLQQQQQINQTQQRFLQQQGQEIRQLQSQMPGQQMYQSLEPGQSIQYVAPTGTGGWFNQGGVRNQFMNTSRFFSRTSPSTSSSARPR
jgi:hypothetical protein